MSELKKIERKMKKKPYVPASDDPRTELRRLVQQHVALTRGAVAIEHMASDRKNRETGESIPTRIPLDVAAYLKGETVAKMKADADRLERDMLRELKKLPIYTQFLSCVYGCGPVVAAYLVSYVDFDKATKPSNLRRFCGMAVIDGRLERRTSQPKTQGGEGTYVAELRTRLFQMFAAMARNSVRGPVTSKYIEVWKNDIYRLASSERRAGDKILPIRPGDSRPVSIAGFARSRGWHKAADVFLEDFYTVGRAMAGLPVWPSYYAAKLGYEHGGKICVNEPKTLSVDEALALVGDVGSRPCASPPLPAFDQIDAQLMAAE